MNMFLPCKILEKKLLNLLAEDIGEGDLTTDLIVPAGAIVHAEVKCKEAGVAAGVEEATVFLESLGLRVQASIKDGDEMKSNQIVMKVCGDARTILSAERTLLNLISRMSGIATITRNLVREIQKSKLKTKVACTRKTAPGLLYFDKKAVYVGGGDTHRLHLDDMILIKTNHIVIAGSLKEAVRKAREKASFSKKIEVEVTNTAEAVKAAEAGVDIIMLDNFSQKQIEGTIKALEETCLLGKTLLEVSGGITGQNILKFASKKVDIISLGEITESARALDMSLKVRKKKTTSNHD